MIKRLNAEKAPAAIGPYCHGTIVNGILYSSGQIPLDPATGEVVSGGVKAETTRVLDNLTVVLEAAGTSWDNVLKTTLFLADMGDFPVINEIYATYVGDNAPARSTIQIAALPKGCQIEIELTAVIP